MIRMEIVQFAESYGDARAAKRQVQFRSQAPHHVFEIVAIDEDRFASLQAGIEHSAVFAAAEIAQNGDPKRCFGIGELDGLTTLTGFDFDFGKRGRPGHDTATLAQVEEEIEPEAAERSDGKPSRTSSLSRREVGKRYCVLRARSELGPGAAGKGSEWDRDFTRHQLRLLTLPLGLYKVGLPRETLQQRNSVKGI